MTDLSSLQSGPPGLPERPAPSAHREFIDLLHDLGGVLWEMDARTWRFTFVSERAERLFGYSVDRWYDEPTFWQDTLLHPDDRSWCVNYCSSASADCRNHAFLYRARAADGETLWIKDVVRVIPDGTGAPSVMRGVMVDVTEEIGTRDMEGLLEVSYEAPELASIRRILAA